MTVITLADVSSFIDALGDLSAPKVDLAVTPAFWKTLRERYPAPAYHPDSGRKMEGLGLLQGITVIVDPDLPVPWRFVDRVKA